MSGIHSLFRESGPRSIPTIYLRFTYDPPSTSTDSMAMHVQDRTANRFFGRCPHSMITASYGCMSYTRDSQRFQREYQMLPQNDVTPLPVRYSKLVWDRMTFFETSCALLLLLLLLQVLITEAAASCIVSVHSIEMPTHLNTVLLSVRSSGSRVYVSHE